MFALDQSSPFAPARRVGGRGRGCVVLVRTVVSLNGRMTPNTTLQPTGQKLRFCPSAELRR